MTVQTISERVLSVGAADPNLQFFDRVMPTPYGTTYNSYLILGDEKIALIDPVQDNCVEQLLSNLAQAGVKKIDYILCLHTEQDHAGSTSVLQTQFPDAQLVATKKVAELMEIHLHIPQSKFHIMEAGDELDLGGLTLTCYPIPFAHWPDNTMYYLEEEGKLFSSDLFGSHYAAEPYREIDKAKHIENTRAYYSEIMMPMRKQVARHLQTAKDLNPQMICPAHGPVWDDPQEVFDLYDDFVSDRVKRRVVMPLVSMHGSSEKIAFALAKRLEEKGIPVNIHRLDNPNCDFRVSMGEVIADVVDAACLIMAAPTVLVGPHPLAADMAIHLNAFKPKLRYLGLVGSFGWGSQIERNLYSIFTQVKAEKLDSLLVKGLATEEDYKKIDQYADMIEEKLMSIPEEELL